MNRYAAFLAVILCIALLAGCGVGKTRQEPAAPETEPPVSAEAADHPDPAPAVPEEPEAPAEQKPDTPAPEEEPTAGEPAPEEEPSPETPAEPEPMSEPEPNPEPDPEDAPPADENTYTLRLSGLVPIFDAPTYDGCYVQNVGEDGVYTIVEEQTDAEGIIWGKLKSGIGWIDLSALEADVPVFAGLAEESILEQPHHIVIVDDSEFMEYLVFQATETLKDVRLFFLLPSEAGYEEDSILHTIPEMTPEKPLVAEVVFYGDFTTYGLSFTDESGQTRYFAMYISGRNGAPVLQEYEP